MAELRHEFQNESAVALRRDREAILEGLADGTIEILCSDHAPHCDYEKEVEFDYAPFGITGLETELALSLMQLVHTKRISLADMIAKFTRQSGAAVEFAKRNFERRRGRGRDGF